MSIMTEDRLIEIISAYGADEASWPAAERAAAKTALDRFEDARSLLAREAALDDLIALPQDELTRGALKARILLSARGQALKPAARFPHFQAIWRPACVLLASAALGICLGAAAQVPSAAAPVVIAADDPPQQLVLTVSGDSTAPEEME